MLKGDEHTSSAPADENDSSNGAQGSQPSRNNSGSVGIEWIREKYAAIACDLDERGRRRWAAAEARSLGWGGITAVALATGISDRTVRTGIKELDDPEAAPSNRQRLPGAGRRTREAEQPGLADALEELVESGTRGDPMSALRWICKSTRTLADELQRQGFHVSCNTVGQLLRTRGYPPGTSKWNKIEHRLFCHITRNWQGVPLETHEIVVQLIGATKTDQGLEVHAWLDEATYEKARKVSNSDLATVRIKRNKFHGEWNYEIIPRKQITKRIR